jgi:hypothetical protein
MTRKMSQKLFHLSCATSAQPSYQSASDQTGRHCLGCPCHGLTIHQHTQSFDDCIAARFLICPRRGLLRNIIFVSLGSRRFSCISPCSPCPFSQCAPHIFVKCCIADPARAEKKTQDNHSSTRCRLDRTWTPPPPEVTFRSS